VLSGGRFKRPNPKTNIFLICGCEVPADLVEDYAKIILHSERATNNGVSGSPMTDIMKAREKAHDRIAKIVGLHKYDEKFNTELAMLTDELVYG
jgi:hypothetical protein